MMLATKATDIGNLVADAAISFVGMTSTHHSTYETGIYLPELGEESRFRLTPQQQGFLENFAGLRWKRNYFTYLEEVHLPYSPEIGLDCSLLTQLSMQRTLEKFGVKTEVPRHVREQYPWPLTIFVPTDRLMRGDQLFAHANKSLPDHTAIYNGNGEVIHSPGIDGGKVGIVRLERFTAPMDVPPFYGSLVAAKRLMSP